MGDSVTHRELVREISVRCRMTLRQAESAIDMLATIVVQEAQMGQRQLVPGLGVFRRGTRKARHITNPRTGERMALPEMVTLKFTAAKAAKERLR